MTNLLMLIPVALVLGAMGLVAFLWALRSGQFDDLDGAAHRILFDEDEMEGAEQHPRPAKALPLDGGGLGGGDVAVPDQPLGSTGKE